MVRIPPPTVSGILGEGSYPLPQARRLFTSLENLPGDCLVSGAQGPSPQWTRLISYRLNPSGQSSPGSTPVTEQKCRHL